MDQSEKNITKTCNTLRVLGLHREESVTLFSFLEPRPTPIWASQVTVIKSSNKPRAAPLRCAQGMANARGNLITIHITNISRPLTTYYDVKKIDSNSSIIGYIGCPHYRFRSLVFVVD